MEQPLNKSRDGHAPLSRWSLRLAKPGFTFPPLDPGLLISQQQGKSQGVFSVDRGKRAEDDGRSRATPLRGWRKDSELNRVRILTWNIQSGAGSRVSGVLQSLRAHEPDIAVLT